MIELDIKYHVEAKEYGGYEFVLSNESYIFRKSKVTPKKIGQFVTLWKRSESGETSPYDNADGIDFVIVDSSTEDNEGFFVFPKEVLLSKRYFSDRSKNRDGKRGFRVYPSWDRPESKQAISTQKWQLNYFFTGKFSSSRIVNIS